MKGDVSKLLALTLPVVLIWGLNFAVMRIGVTNVGPFALAAMRFAFASVPFLPFISPPNVPVAFLIAYSAAFALAQFTLLFLAIGMGLPSGLASLILQLQAVFTPALTFILFSERCSRYTLLAMAASLFGLGAIVWSASGEIGQAVAPVLLCVGAAASWALSNVVVRYGVRKGYVYRPVALVVWASLVATVPFLVLSMGLGEHMHVTPSTLLAGALSALYLGLLGTLVAYALWVRALSDYDAATVAPFSLLIPVIGIATGYAVFGEALDGFEVAGSALIMLGLTAHIAGAIRRRTGPAKTYVFVADIHDPISPRPQSNAEAIRSFSEVARKMLRVA
jgi:O-acetylserine/cysteine efflux transporter